MVGMNKSRITALLKAGRLESKLQDEWRESGKEKGSKCHKSSQREDASPLTDGSCISPQAGIQGPCVELVIFMMARTAEGRAFRILTIIDEYTRECLTILTQRRITSEDVIEQLFYMFIFRGTPQYILI